MKRRYKVVTINGIKTVLYPIRDVGAVKLELNIRAGSAHEKGDNWGAFHFMEHLAYQGTKKFPTRFKIEDFKERHGLKGGAYVSNDRTGYWVKASHLSLEPALAWINEQAFNPTFPQESFVKEISVISNEYNDLWDSIGKRFWSKLVKQLYGNNHLYARDAIGQPKFLKNLTRDDLVRLHRKYFTANNCCLVVTGNFSLNRAENAIKNILKPAFKNKPKFTKIPPVKSGSRKIVHHEKIDQEEIILTWPLPGFRQISLAGKLGIGVANYILGVGSNSILNKNIREKYGLTYGVSSARVFRGSGGYLEIKMSTDPKNSDRSLKLLRKLTYDFVSNSINPARFEQARKYMDLQTTIDFDSVDSINDILAGSLFNHGKPLFPEDYVETAKAVTPQSVSKIIRKYITPEKELLAIMKRK